MRIINRPTEVEIVDWFRNNRLAELRKATFAAEFTEACIAELLSLLRQDSLKLSALAFGHPVVPLGLTWSNDSKTPLGSLSFANLKVLHIRYHEVSADKLVMLDLPCLEVCLAPLHLRIPFPNLIYLGSTWKWRALRHLREWHPRSSHRSCSEQAPPCEAASLVCKNWRTKTCTHPNF
jgi:hypothetical protein